MDEAAIQEAVDAMAKAMGDIDMKRPEARVWFTSEAPGQRIMLSWGKAGGDYGEEYKCFSDGELSDQIDAANAWIAAQLTAEERKARASKAGKAGAKARWGKRP